MITRTLILAAALAAWPAAGPAQQTATGPGLELRVGGAAGGVQGTGAGFELVPGASWAIAGSLPVRSWVEVFAGIGAAGFGCRNGFCRDQAIRFRSTGAEVGVLLAPPGGHPAEGPWFRLALLGHRLTWQADAGSASGPFTLGAEGGLEWRFPVATRVSLAPGLRASVYIDEEPDGRSRGVVFMRGDLGVRVRPFGR